MRHTTRPTLDNVKRVRNSAQAARNCGTQSIKTHHFCAWHFC